MNSDGANAGHSDQTNDQSLSVYPILDAIASNRMNRDVIDAVWLALQQWLAHGGGTPINRYLRLPATPGKLRDASRNLWLIRAARELKPTSNQTEMARQISRELQVFVSRGPWQSWKHDTEPPPEASELRKALFFAMKFGGGELIEERQIYRILQDALT